MWYLAYGSNTLKSRLSAYLDGAASGPYGPHDGARDATRPARERAVRVNRGVYFAGNSKRWHGPVAFLDLAPGGACLGRAYLLSLDQVADIAAQENGDAGTYPLRELPEVGGYLALPTAGKYDALLRLADHDRIPTVTLTTSRALPRGVPPPAYVDTIRSGLTEAAGFAPQEIDAYVAGLLTGKH